MSLLNRLGIYTLALLLSVLGVTTYLVGSWGVASIERQMYNNNKSGAEIVTSLAPFMEYEQRVDQLCLALYKIPDREEFRSVELLNSSGERKCYQANEEYLTNAPSWFKNLFEIKVISTTSKLNQAGSWSQPWTLIITPYEAYAYDQLWQLTKQTILSLVLLFIAAGVMGLLVLKKLLVPLKEVVAQAKSVGERRFAKIAIPSTREFADVARSMNELSDRVETMLVNEASALRERKALSDQDETTGLLNRETFLDQFTAKLSRENEESIGSVALIRILRLAEMNREYGRPLIDTLLKDIGDALNQLSDEQHYGGYCSVGRLNGADICAVATNERNAKNLADAMQRAVSNTLSTHNIDESFGVAATCIEYQLGDSTGALLSAMDGGLAQSELQTGTPIVPAQRTQRDDPGRANQRFWQTHLSDSLEHGGLQLVWFPALRKDKSVLHLEGMARLVIGEQEFNAGEFMPWIFRLGLGQAFDQAVVAHALKTLPTTQERLHVNLSADSLKGSEFASWLKEQLKNAKGDISRFGVEISETAVIGAKPSFQSLMTILKSRGCQLGIEHMGYRPEIIADLGSLGPDYLKVDSLYTQDLATNTGNRSVLSTFSGIAKSLGIDCIAEGINTVEDGNEAFELGVRGVSGRAVG